MVTQWVIYDSYVEYEYQKELQEEQEKFARLCEGMKAKQGMKRLLPDETADENAKFERTFLRAARTLERMVNQNIYHDIALGKFFFIPNNVVNGEILIKLPDSISEA